jgi:flagellar hook protein FlgE
VQREQEAEGVALEKEAVEQMSATYAFKANLQTIKAQDEMMGSLLDVKA